MSDYEDPVQQLIRELNDTSLRPDQLRMKNIPPHRRVYTSDFLQALNTEKVASRPFINIPPGRIQDLRTSFHIACVARENGQTLVEAMVDYKNGAFQLPETPESEREGRRYFGSAISHSDVLPTTTDDQKPQHKADTILASEVLPTMMDDPQPQHETEAILASEGLPDSKDNSIEIIVDIPEIQTEQNSGPDAKLPDQPKNDGFVLNTYQIEPNAQYDELLTGDKLLTCPLCTSGKQYNRRNKLLKHFDMRHYYCETCDEVFLHREGLVDHLLAKVDVHHFCAECELDFQTTDAYLRHQKKIHPPKDTPINCPGCRHRCENAGAVLQHLEIGACKNISKRHFNVARVVTALIQRHGLGPIAECSPDQKNDIREQSFKLLRGDNSVVNGLPLVKESGWSPSFNAELHMSLHNGKEIYACPYTKCNSGFGMKSDFVNHLRGGHFEPGGVCPGCFKEFPKASALLSHMMKGSKVCKLSRGFTFSYAVSAVSGGYVKAEAVDMFGKWKYSAGIAPKSELYMDLPEVSA